MSISAGAPKLEISATRAMPAATALICVIRTLSELIPTIYSLSISIPICPVFMNASYYGHEYNVPHTISEKVKPVAYNLLNSCKESRPNVMQLQHVRSYMYVTTEIVPKYGQDSDSNSTARNQFAAASYMYM